MINRGNNSFSPMAHDMNVYPMMRISPLNTGMRPIGKTTSSWDMAPVFSSAMSQFGRTYEDRIVH